MKMIFIGSGSAFTVDENNFHSNALLLADTGEKMLIDCGSDARRALHKLGYRAADISSVYITHFHADHIGGLEWLGMATKFDERVRAPQLYLEQTMLQRLWDMALSAGMISFPQPEISLSTFFEVCAIGEEKSFVWCGLMCNLVRTIHVEDSNGVLPSYGLFMTYKNKHIFFTGDTRFDPQRLWAYYQKADVIFQDCETATLCSGVHANYEQLRTLSSEVKAKMYLYHYNDGALPDAKRDGFKGFVAAGQSFDLAKL